MVPVFETPVGSEACIYLWPDWMGMNSDQPARPARKQGSAGTSCEMGTSREMSSPIEAAAATAAPRSQTARACRSPTSANGSVAYRISWPPCPP